MRLLLHHSSMRIEKIAVIGSGVMGSGIAAHIANAGLPVLLFDLEAPGKVITGMRDKGPGGPLMLPERADLIEACSLTTDLARLGEADWICEVIVENLSVKQDLYAKIEQHRKAHSVISSNTSTIPLSQLVDGRSPSFREHFLITHFFNPPRQMRLLELVTGDDTLGPVADLMTMFCQNVLGKGVVPCHDRPGFIANRIGTYWMMLALHKAIEDGIGPDAADAALAKAYGIPKTGVFGLMDLIGLDLMPKMAHSLASNLPDSDPFQKVAGAPAILKEMIAQGYTGRKGKGGFTRMEKSADGMKTKLTVDLAKEFDPATSYQTATTNDDATAWAKSVMDDTLAYAKSLLGEVADDKAAIDAAMIWGYGWKKGPFALLGDNIILPKPEGALFADCKKIIAENEHAVLLDMGDKVGLLTPKTKMNVFDTGLFDLLEQALTMDLQGLVIGTDAPHFSAGANLERFLSFADNNDWAGLESFIKRGQHVMKAVRIAPLPVVAAINGYVMGGACELTMHATAVVAHSEVNIGLVEPRVGVIPAWGGCLEALRRLGAEEALKAILAQWTSASALDARQKGYLAEDDRIIMNRDLLLVRGKQLALSLDVPEAHTFKATSVQERTNMEAWLEQSDYGDLDKEIGRYLIETLCAPNEESVWLSECDGFIALMKREDSRNRMRSILG